MYTRYYKNLSEMDFEDAANKEIVPIEIFYMKVIRELNGLPSFYNDYLLGVIDSVSHKYQIGCKETYNQVFDFGNRKLRESGR